MSTRRKPQYVKNKTYILTQKIKIKHNLQFIQTQIQILFVLTIQTLKHSQGREIQILSFLKDTSRISPISVEEVQIFPSSHFPGFFYSKLIRNIVKLLDFTNEPRC